MTRLCRGFPQFEGPRSAPVGPGLRSFGSPLFPLFDTRKFCYRDRRVIDVRQVQGSDHG